MLTVFIEYKLDAAKREKGLLLLAAMVNQLEQKGAKQHRFFEGLDQPGLFVETFDVDSARDYEQIKQWRLADADFCDCVLGGAAKLNVWAFCPVDLHIEGAQQ